VHTQKKKKKGVTWVVQATTSQRNPGCTEKRILVQDQDGGNAQHGKERTQHHKHMQKGLSERRGPRAMHHTRKACHTDRRASTSKEPNTHTQFPGANTLNVHTQKKKKCYTVLTQLRCKKTAGTKRGSRNDKGRSTNPTSKGSKHTLSVPSGVTIGVAMGGSCVEHWVERDD
jgi:hypothetical protein